jgi:PAS domain S-box-containing protein
VENQVQLVTTTPRYRLILRGESAVASVGIALAAIVLLAMAAAGWWTLRTQKQSLQLSRINQVRTIGAILSQTAESMLASNDLSPLRRLVADAARDHQLSLCRVALPDGQVIADANPARISAKKLPATWSETAPAEAADDGNPLSVSYPLVVPGRGVARLEVTGTSSDGWVVYWQSQAGVGAISAATLFALLLVYRRLRARLMAMGAIGEALLAASRGEATKEALMVADEFGAEARAWNELLDQKDKLRRQFIAEQVNDTLGNRSEAKSDLEAAFDCMSQGLVLVDDKLCAKYANGAATIFLETKREELIGADLTTLVQDEQVLNELRSVAQKGSRRRSTYEVKRQGKAGMGVLRFSIRPVRREDPAAAMIIIDDITQQRVAEEARNTFIAHATHELRTPLTNIRLYVESAIEDGENDPVLRTKALNVINQETRRLERIVGEMLSVSEIEAGAFKLKTSDLYLDAVFEEIKPDYVPQAKEKDITLAFNLPPKLPAIKGDRDKILVALHNLIGNAMKYTPKGGSVTINVEHKNGQLTVDVADTGIGISEEDQQKVFDKFFRANDPRVGKITGTGLGLTLAQEVVRLHGGSITLQSELNKGSTFTLSLPTLAEAA